MTTCRSPTCSRTRCGATVASGSSGWRGGASEGLALCGREQPDVAILDVELPDASGLDQVHAIQRLSPHTRILVFSGHAAPVLVRRALEAGVHGYIGKPADLGTLLKALRQVSGGSLSFSRQVLPGRRVNPPADIAAFPSSALIGGAADERIDAGLKVGFGLLFLALVLAWVRFINLSRPLVDRLRAAAPMSSAAPEIIRLVIVEDHSSIRELLIEAFKALGGFEVVGEASTAREGLELCLREKPDVVVLDIMLPDENGLDSARAIRHGSPKTKILIFSANTNTVLISRALEQGVHGFIEKTARFSDLVSAVRAVAANAICFGESLLPTLQQIRRSPFPLDAASRLTARERTILAAIAAGKSSKSIAAELGLSVFTVNNHRRRIKAKTGLRGTSDLTLHALRLGLVTDPAGSLPAAAQSAQAVSQALDSREASWAEVHHGRHAP